MPTHLASHNDGLLCVSYSVVSELHLMQSSKHHALHLEYLLASIHCSLKLINNGVEGRVGPSCPLKSLGDTELLAVDLVNNTGQCSNHLLLENLDK